MSSTTDSGEQARMIIGYAVTNKGFRESIIGKSVEEIQTAVEASAGSIGAGLGKVPNNVYQAIHALNQDDMSALIAIYNKVSDHGIGERNML